jgi:L-lactate dehydrogenase complex protein LldG
MSSRDALLGRVRAAVAGSGRSPATPPVPRAYRRSGGLASGGPAVLALLAERLREYKAQVHDATAGDAVTHVLAALGDATSVVVPAGMPPEFVEPCRVAGLRMTADGAPGPLTNAELDAADAVITTAAVACAAVGAIVLDGGPGQGRRAVSLVPDRHVVVLDAARVVETLPEALALLDPTRPMTIIAGPSATSDIELSRVEGVHGPRRLHVVITAIG